MKISKKIACNSCLLKCDLYEVMKNSGQKIPENKVIRASFRKHENICRQGDSLTHAIYLAEGIAKLYIKGLNTHNIILYLLKPPSYIGLLSFFESIHYTYTVTALDNSTVCMVDLEFLKSVYLRNNEMLLKLNKAFGQSVALIMRKIICLNQKYIRGRIAESLIYLSSFYGSHSFILPVTRKELGEMSAVSEENTVRLLSELNREGIISLRGKEVTINDICLLQKISDLG